MRGFVGAGCVAAIVAVTLAVAGEAQTDSPGGSPAPVYPPAPPGIAVVHDLVIGKGGGRDLHANIAYPQNGVTPLAAVIFIHGGGWVAGTYRSSPIVRLAQSGYFAASIEYRLSGEAKWPAQIQDCKLGVRWLRSNAARYHVDPNRIAAWGPSAGGHLSACLGTMADVAAYEGDGGFPGVSSAVQAVIDCFGPTDLTNPAIYTPRATDVTEKLFGVPLAQNPGLWKSGVPVDYVKAGDPPMLLIHGDSDTLVPLAQSTVFDEALTKAGVPHQFLIVKNGGHAFAPMNGKELDPGIAEIQKTVDGFLARYLKGR